MEEVLRPPVVKSPGGVSSWFDKCSVWSLNEGGKPPGCFVRNYAPASRYTLPPLAEEMRRPKRVGGGYEDLTPYALTESAPSR